MFSLSAGAFSALLAALTPSLTETAVANGDTRTINLYHAHTQESISATYLVNGQYDQAVLQKLNWFLRDWRRDEPTQMDPRLFDVIWEAYRTAGVADEPVHVVSAYRSPETNAMLRARSRAVAKYSQHMLGKAMDTTMPGMPMSHIREIGMRMQRGGVGYYPTAGTPFVHLDVGNVRAWPRMTYDQLARLFPDGKTVHLPSNGQPLARYEEAKAEIEARNNGAIVVAPRKSFGGLLAFLFGGGEDEAEDAAPPEAPAPRKQWAQLPPRGAKDVKVAAAETDEEGGQESSVARSRASLAKAEANLPHGETAMVAAENDASAAARGAPLPPGRPAALDKTAAPEDDVKSRSNFEAARAQEQPEIASAPLPPRRPRSLLVVADTPLPPVRPKILASLERGGAAGALNSLIDATNSIGPPPGAQLERAKLRTEPAEALAYAPPSDTANAQGAAATPEAAQKPAAPETFAEQANFAPARLDRSNFWAMTGSTPASLASAASVLGNSIGTVRSAARAAEQSTLTFASSVAAPSFSTEIAAPAADRFEASDH
jgi:uncharacterized protein YcbK (DUF882 family)